MPFTPPKQLTALKPLLSHKKAGHSAQLQPHKIMRKIIDLYPEAPNEWVYRDHDDDMLPDGTPRRQFEPSVTIPLSDLDLWHECTDQQRRDWEEQHPEPSPEQSPEPEPEQKGGEV